MNVTTPAPPVPIVLTADAIAALPQVALDESIPGVTHCVLWRDGGSTAGVMTVGPGHHLGRHAHHAHHHHMWLLAGAATILGSEVGPGAYVHIPAGIEHDIDTTSTDGVTVFYLYAPPNV